MCPSRAVNEARLEGVVGKRAGAHCGVLRAEAQIGLVVNEACGDDDMCVVVGRCPGASPQSLERTGNLKGNVLGQKTKTLKKGMVVVRVQGGMRHCVNARIYSLRISPLTWASQ